MLKKLSLTALAISLILILVGCNAQSAQELQLRTTAQQIRQAVQIELNELDLDLANASAELSTTGLSGTEARRILNELTNKYPLIIDASTTDAAGKMVTVAPDAYSNYEGTDISTQDVVIQLNETKKPLLSQMFPAVEGMDAVVIMWPVFSQNGDFMGSVSALFVPATLLSPASEPILRGTDIALDVMQLDGLDIYNSNGVDTGINIFTYPEFQQYTDLIALGHQMVAEESGSGSYTIKSYETGELVKKAAYWETVKLHDTPWRVVTTQNIK
jgi:uncharacterized lipoprotein NlpE involved in copper resistance